MIKKAVNSDGAPSAVGPYSHSVLAGDTLFVSGQLGLNPTTGKLPEGVAAQAEQAIQNLGAILETSGLNFKDVVKTTVLLKDIADFATINEIYGKYFTELLPARSCFEVGNLPAGGLFEIEAVAVKD